MYFRIIFCCLVGIPTTASHAQSMTLADRLGSCAVIDNDLLRLECYDQLGREVLADDETSNDKAAIEDVRSPPTSVPPRPPFKSEPTVEEYEIVVTSCEHNNVGDTYFVLDSGEIWKRTGGNSMRARKCSFSATLRKDIFGYKMSIDNEKGSIRVKRIR